MSFNVTEILSTLLKDKNTYLIPPRVDDADREKLLSHWKNTSLKRHAFITSSGTTGSFIKSYALSYEALKSNALAVNNIINASSEDRWLSSLPIYHIGGLSIYIRAMLSNSEVISFQERWNAHTFLTKLKNENIQFCSLVPTQLFDLVMHNLSAPKCLKAIFVGGDFLPDVIKKKAIELNWPIYLTFGMTEVCSQLATSHYKDAFDGYLKILPIFDVQIHEVQNNEERLMVKGPSLFTDCYRFDGSSFYSIKNSKDYSDDFFITNDLVELVEKNGLYLKHIGRVGDEIKVNGRLINFSVLKNTFSQICDELNIYSHAEIVISSDDRQGKKLELWLENSVAEHESTLCETIKKSTANLLSISTVRYFSQLPRTKLGKLKKG